MFKFLTLTFFILFFTLQVYPESDDWLSDNSSLEIVANKKEKSIGYFEEHFSGYTFTTYSYGDQVKRSIFETRLRFSESIFENTSFSAEYRYQNSTFDTPVQNNSTQDIYNEQFSYTLTEFRELYIYQRINSLLSIKGGRQTIIWGQWSTFSPIDLLLPFDFAIIGPSFNKEQIKQPIESYNLIITPSNEWITTIYYFPKFTLDYTSKESLDFAVQNGETVEYPTQNNEDQLALRSTYMGDDYNLGITFFKGFEILRNKYSILDSYDLSTSTIESSRKYLFPRKLAIVIEANKQLNDNETIGTEILFQNRKVSFDDLSDYSSSELTNANDNNAVQNYLNWITESNEGLLYSNQFMLISSLAYEKSIRRHVFKISMSYIHLFNSDHTNDGFDLFNKTGLSTESEDWTDTYRFLGSLTYLYYLTDDQNQSVGTMLGFLGSGIGASIFYGLSFYEAFSFGVGIEYIKYLTDMSYGTSNTGESVVNVNEISYRTGLQYLF